ncbi:MAG: L,D-transpeptidase family protein [Patescibacteria group bacterium]
MRRFFIPASVILLLLVVGGGIFLWAQFTSPSPQLASVIEALNTVTSTLAIPPIILPTLYKYVEVADGCGPYFTGTCVNMRSGPGTEYPVVLRLRTGMVLRVEGVAKDTEGRPWYKIDPGVNIRYPERITTGWYILADAVLEFKNDGDHRLEDGDHATSTKSIIIDRLEEMLYAYDGDTLFMEQPISVGLEGTPTPRGTFTVYAMTPSRYMQGPIPGVSDQEYDLPGVPWNLYFTVDGAVIHGAYWHDRFGEPWSHGCVNLPPEKAKELYMWADLGTLVTVRN